MTVLRFPSQLFLAHLARPLAVSQSKSTQLEEASAARTHQKYPGESNETWVIRGADSHHAETLRTAGPDSAATSRSPCLCLSTPLSTSLNSLRLPLSELLFEANVRFKRSTQFPSRPLQEVRASQPEGRSPKVVYWSCCHSPWLC